MTALQQGRAIADAVLYEGYLLYPYTASALKNQMRWQFGVVMPRAFASLGNGERSRMQCELALRTDGGRAPLDLLVRFLRVQTRDVEELRDGMFVRVHSLRAGTDEYLSWEEATPEEIELHVDLDSECPLVRSIELPAGYAVEELRDDHKAVVGRIVRRRAALRGHVTLTARNEGALRRLVLAIDNDSDPPDGTDRAVALRSAFVSIHALLALERGVFCSLLDPTDDAAHLVVGCRNDTLWPVLLDTEGANAHESPAVLCSPIILYDFPSVAAESHGETFDGTEIDELLHLSVLALSDREKRELRATDPAARAILDRAEGLVPGARVRLRPSRRADVWDSIVDGMSAHVEKVYEDVDGTSYIGVTVDDDPASELHRWYGRSLFFYPDEVEPIEAAPEAPRVLVACVGNIFFGDDGFGVDVARALAQRTLPAGTNVEDFGIRGMHLAYEMIDGYDLVVIVDAVHRDAAPGTLYVIEPSPTAPGGDPDAHGMELENVFAMIRRLGETMPATLIVGCEPERTSEDIGLSTSVANAVEPAATLVTNLVTKHARRIARKPATTEAPL